MKIYKLMKVLYNPMTKSYGLRIFHTYSLNPIDLTIPEYYQIQSEDYGDFEVPEGYKFENDKLVDSIGNYVELVDFGCEPAIIPNNTDEECITLKKIY